MVEWLKRSAGAQIRLSSDVADTVAIMLAHLRTGGEAAARDYAARLDSYTGPVVVGAEEIAAAKGAVPPDLRAAIDYAHDNIARFARAQRETIHDMSVELRPGLTAGQRVIPVGSVGAYVPGGRYAHIASALMSIATARAAGVPDITACTPPRSGAIPAPVLYAMDLAGASRILRLGGVQGIAAMAFGLFGAPGADILVGPGNAYVAEAKRQLFGPVGIDSLAGPTDSLIVADETADADTVAWDLAGQAEHGATSPVWLVSTSRALAQAVLHRMPGVLGQLPQPNRDAAEAAWRDFGEVALCATREAAATLADAYAPEHLHVQAADPGWWLIRLRNYGSLFLGAETTVAFGDKAAGPNHVLPTSGTARYTGGLSVHKFLKTVTWQSVAPAALPELAAATATISRAEGMEGHARTADLRLDKHAPRPKLAASDKG